MLEIDGDVRCGHMRCAKRSSAALRTAVALEAAAEALQVEKHELQAKPVLPPDLRPVSVVHTMKRKRPSTSTTPDADEGRGDSSSEVAKFRRDIKNSFEQHERAVSCGDVPLVRIPILGRVVRMFGDWLALCSFCGCVTKVLPTSRFRGDLCCTRCDFALMVGKEAAAEMDAALPKEPSPACRYCGKVQPENCTGAKWRKVDAPLDANGKNATVPAPLRICFLLSFPFPFVASDGTPEPEHERDLLASRPEGTSRPRCEDTSGDWLHRLRIRGGGAQADRHIQTKVCPRQTNRQEQSKSPPDHRHASTRVSCLVKPWLLCPKKAREKHAAHPQVRRRFARVGSEKGVPGRDFQSDSENE